MKRKLKYRWIVEMPRMLSGDYLQDHFPYNQPIHLITRRSYARKFKRFYSCNGAYTIKIYDELKQRYVS